MSSNTPPAISGVGAWWVSNTGDTIVYGLRKLATTLLANPLILTSQFVP